MKLKYKSSLQEFHYPKNLVVVNFFLWVHKNLITPIKRVFFCE